MKNYKVLVIIVTYNGEKRCKEVINGINNSNIKLDTIIIDNGSKDKTLELYEKSLDNIVKIVRNKKNLGFGGANNIGFEYAIDNNYDYVYLLNQDAWFFEDTVENLINLCENTPNLGIISPFQCGKGFEKVDKNFQIGACGYNSNNDLFSDIYFGRLKDVYEVSRVMAAHRMMPISVLKKVGGFSPTFFHYGEDDNYADRVKYFGYKIYIAPNINVIHDRNNREESIDKLIHIGYVYVLNILSNPTKKTSKSFFMVFFYSLYYSIKYKSFKPINNYFKILKQYPNIIKNKKISINNNRAFLNNK